MDDIKTLTDADVLSIFGRKPTEVSSDDITVLSDDIVAKLAKGEVA